MIQFKKQNGRYQAFKDGKNLDLQNLSLQYPAASHRDFTQAMKNEFSNAVNT